MTLNKLLAVLPILVAGAAFAQAPLGTVSNVQGVVTATQGATGITVAPGTPITSGMRFVTTSRGSVTLRLNSGCTVTVPAGHGVTVIDSMSCQQLAAAVQPVVPVAANGPFGPAPGVVDGAVALGAAAIAAGFIHEATEDDDDDRELSAR